MACVSLQEHLTLFHVCERGSDRGWKGVSGWDLTPSRPGHTGLPAVWPDLDGDAEEGTCDAAPPCDRCRDCRGNLSQGLLVSDGQLDHTTVSRPVDESGWLLLTFQQLKSKPAESSLLDD